MSNRKTKRKNADTFYISVYDFLYSHWISMVVVIVIMFLSIMGCIYVKYSRKNKIRIYNEKMFTALAIKDTNEKIKQLNSLYEDKKNPEKSRNMVAIQIMKEYFANRDYDKAKSIGNTLLKSKDNYIKYFAGLNILMMENSRNINNYKELTDLIAIMEKKDNPFINLILEQKAILLMRQEKDKEAKDIFNQLLSKNNIDSGLKARIREYISILN